MEQVQTYNSAATTIKNAILNAQYEAAKGVNNIQLTLYYSIGRYISQNSRNGKWGTHAIATISQLLKEDMPGLRGYSETNMKRMRSFYEEWTDLDPVLNSPVKTDKLQHADNKQIINSSGLTDDISSVKPDEIIRTLRDIEQLKK